MKRTLLFVSFALAICFCAMTSQAQAQASRTWVSGLGDDANPCSRTAPCKTFAGALSRTADCGEIDAFDPGGYGSITLTKGIKIDGGGGEGGQVASILAGSGAPGVVVNNTSVGCPFNVLRNLDITGVNVGSVGINIIAGGTLALENVDIENFTQQCINDQPVTAVGLTMYNTNVEHCQTGLVVSAGSFSARAVVSRSQFSKMTGTSGVGVGISVGNNGKVSVRDSDINNNSGGGVLASGATAFVMLQHDQISNNQAFGVHTTNQSVINMADSSITFNNGTGVLADLGTAILTWNNNWVTQNNPDGARSGTIAPF